MKPPPLTALLLERPPEPATPPPPQQILSSQAPARAAATAAAARLDAGGAPIGESPRFHHPTSAAPSFIPLPTIAPPAGSVGAAVPGEGLSADAGGAGGAGSGNGAGTGSGKGAGSGGGSGSGGSRSAEGVHRAEWIVKPEQEMVDHVPHYARLHRTGGEVLLSCMVDDRRCIVLSEKPAGYGYGSATLKLSRLFRIKPPVVDGKSRYDVRVYIPIRYDPR